MPIPSECPAWCDRQHLRDASDQDPIHEQDGAVLPGVLRTVSREPGIRPAVIAAGCDVRPVLFSSAIYPDETWLALERGEHGPGITLNAETWRRVVPALETLLGLH